MSGIPYYRIKDCCTSQEALINISPAAPVTADGIYKWTNLNNIKMNEKKSGILLWNVRGN